METKGDGQWRGVVKRTERALGSGQIWVLCGCLLVVQLFRVIGNGHNKMLGGNCHEGVCEGVRAQSLEVSF